MHKNGMSVSREAITSSKDTDASPIDKKEKKERIGKKGKPQEDAVVADTIFSPSFGNRPSYLIGRETIIREFMHGLESEPGNRDRAMVLLGQRGSGKTVLLWELADRASASGFVVATPTVTSEGMLERIVEKIQEDGERYVKRRRTHLTGGTLGALGFSAELEFSREVQETKSFQFKLAQLARKLTERGHGILILVDELQANSNEIRQLVIAYQELVGERLNIALVMAGLPGAVSATLNDKVLTFLNRARKVSLPPLAISDVDAFYDQAFRKLGIHISSSLRLQAAQSTQGSPYLLQLIGHNIVLRASDGEVNEDVLEAATHAARVDFENDVCKTTLSALSEKDREFLTAMAQDDGLSAIGDIADRLDVTTDYAQKYRRRLLDVGVIQPAGRGKVEFAVPHLRDFLQKEL